MGRHTQQLAARPRTAPAARIPASAALVAALIFLGVSVLLYPATASWFSQVQQSQSVNQYGNSVEELGPAGRAGALAAAEDYNGTLTGGAVLDPFTQMPAGENQAADSEYRRQLALSPDGVMARLRIPAIQADLPVFHGTSDSVLQRGVGHLFGTALPVGGAGTHAVLTGHTGIPESTLFTHLKDLRPGDTIELVVYGEVLSYRVTTTEVILPTETESLRPVQGEDLISLVTCTPTGINTHRLVVTGERIATPAVGAGAGPLEANAGPPWWAAGLGLAAATSITILLVAARRSNRREESQGFPQDPG